MTNDKPAPLGSFHWHNTAQFGGALNDNLFKLMVIYALVANWEGRSEDFIYTAVGGIFPIPFILFIGAAGVLADRIRKHRIVQGIKLLEILVMSVGALGIYLGSPWILMGSVFLMSTQSALFGPTKFGIIPELVGRENISRANSFMQAASYLAMILGTILAPILYESMTKWAGLASIGVAALGWLASLRIEQTPQNESTSTASLFFVKDIFRTLKIIHKDAYLALTAYSAAFFLLIAAFIQLNLLSYGTESLGMDGPAEATFLFVAVAFGIGFGSLLAGRFSRRSIEFGIVPVGSLLMAISCVALWTEPGLVASYVFCGLMGMGAGLFIVPVQSFLQYRSPGHLMGEIIAASGWLSWVGVLFAAGLLYLCSSVLKLTAAQGFLVIAGLIFVMATVAFRVLPDFLMRFIGMLLARFFYRFRASGMENFPSQGGGLVVCNHVSMMDPMWISSMMPRRIRFVMSRSYIENSSPMMQRLFKLAGVIPIHEEDGPKALIKSMKTVRDTIEAGFLVAIFPEGHFTRTGHLQAFRPGFERMVKGLDVPIIPMYLDGAYGTYSSLAHGEPVFMDMRDFRAEITLAIGPHLKATASKEDVTDAIKALASSANDAHAPIRGSAGRCAARTLKKRWGHTMLADSSGKRLTGGQVLIGSLLLRKRLHHELTGDPAEVGVLLPPSVAGSLVNLSLVMNSQVPANLNYTASSDAIKSAMEQAGIKTLITSRKFLEKVPDIPLPKKVLYAEDLLTGFGKLAKLTGLLKARLLPAACLVPDRWWKPEDPLTILFSSGSTAQPKGILLSHHNILSNIDGFSVVARPQDTDCLCSVLPFFHSFGFTVGLWFPLTRGIGVCYHHHPLETEAIGRIAKENKATILMGTPTFLTAWVRKIDPDCFTHLRWVVVGAEKLRPKMADMFERRFGVRPLEGYGATECSPVIAVNVPDVEADGLTQRGTLEGSVGRPLPNMLVKVLNPETGEPVPVGEEGLLWVKGPNVMQRYLNNPEKTEEVLQDGWYNTGDIVKEDEEGFITITDRLTRFSKLAGEMVSHSAVEEALMQALGCTPDKLAVTGVADEKKGEKLMVVYQQDLGDPASFQDKIQALDIPNLWKPDSRNWIAVEELPTLGTGKLDLKGLKQIAQNH